MQQRANSDLLIVAYISGHGFGHAVRASVILGELLREMASLRVIIKTDAPAWLFKGLGERASVMHAKVDAPPVQADAFSMDVKATMAAMRAWLDQKEQWTRAEAAWIQTRGASMVLADISPLALAAAHLAHIPSALVANFTWEWILAETRLDHPLAAALAAEWSQLTPLASWCFCTAPSATIGHPRPIPTGMVGRRCGDDRDEVRRRLGLSAGDTAVLLSFGGLDIHDADFSPLANLDRVVYLSTSPKPGVPRCRCVGRDMDHSLLMHAADVVVGKLGYSTVAEAVIHGTPFVFTPRPHWPEEQILRPALEAMIPCACIPWGTFAAGRFADDLLALAARGKAGGNVAYGAAQVARLLAASMRHDVLEKADLYPPAGMLPARRGQITGGPSMSVSGSCLGV